jgi:hypothetical protein
MTTLDRRNAERARIPCNIPVELTDTGRAAHFEADAIDLSIGGLSLRASSELPDVGTQLICSFEAIPGGAQVLGRGEVVWRQTRAEPGGEFGLRFIEVDARNQAIIDELVAERVARFDMPFDMSRPIIANLEIENVDVPIAVKLVKTAHGEALFEQPLDLLAIGKSVIAHAGASLVRGNIASIAVRMDGTTPMLKLAVKLAPEPARFGEFDWEGHDSDTDPDVFATVGLAEQRSMTMPLPLPIDVGLPAGLAAAESGGTLAGLGAPTMLPAPIMLRDQDSDQMPLMFRRSARDQHDSHDEHEALDAREEGEQLQLELEPLEHEEREHEEREHEEREHEEREHEEPDRVYADENRALELLTQAHVDSYRPPAPAEDVQEPLPTLRMKDADEDADRSVEPELGDESLVRFLGIFARVKLSGQHVVERARTWVSELRPRTGRVVTGSGRHLLGTRPRRVTAGGQPVRAERKLLPIVGITLMGAAAVALFAYVMAPIPEEDTPSAAAQTEQSVAAATDPGATAAESAASPEAISGGPNDSNAATAASSSSGVPNAGTVPSDSPYAVDVRNAAAKPAQPAALKASDAKAAGKNPPPLAAKAALPSSKNPPPSAAKTALPSSKNPPPSAAKAAAVAAKLEAPAASFGQKQVPNAHRFLIRMSGPVASVQGARDASGFSVIVPGARALDKAAPIAAANIGVARAKILNHDDHAELTVQFAPGKSPAYRVSAQGAALEILLAQ